MTFIHRLPVELLDRIVELSCPKESITLTFVSRVFNAIATRYAYRQVSLRGRDQKPHSIQLLLRTLLDQPSVGAHIKDLVIEFTDPVEESHLNHPQSENTPDDLRKLAVDATSRGFPEVNALLNGSIGAMLLLLLCYLPALQSLEVNPSMSLNELFFQRIKEVPALFPALFPALHSLRSVKLSLGKDWGIDWTRVTSFLHLPNISSIHYFDVTIEEFDLDENDDNDNDSDNDNADSSDHGVEVFHLEECMFCVEALISLVKSTRRLKSLIYQHDRSYSGILFFAESLGRALQRYARDTLEILELNFSVDEMHFINRPGALGSLRDFSLLKHVTAPMSLLLDEPLPGLALELGAVLPRSLTSLSIWIDPSWTEAGWELFVIQLLQSKRENVPLLERLHVAGYFDPSLEETIRGACVSGEVDVTFLSWQAPEAQSPSTTSVSPIPAPAALPVTTTPTAIPAPTALPNLSSIQQAASSLPLLDAQLFPSSDIDFERDFGQWFNNDEPYVVGPWRTWGDPWDADQPGPSTSHPIPVMQPPQTPTIKDDTGIAFDGWGIVTSIGQSGQATSSAADPRPPPIPPQVFLPANGSTFPSTSSAPAQTPSQPASLESTSIENVASTNDLAHHP